MIIHMARNATAEQVQTVFRRIEAKKLKGEIIHGATGTDVIGVLGDLGRIEESYFSELDGVEKVIRISKPYKLIARRYVDRGRIVEKPTHRIRVGAADIGGPALTIMAGPCSVESREQVFATARYVRELGIPVLRGGAYKPRSSPYSFQGLGREGLEILVQARAEFGLAIVTEATGQHRHIGPDGVAEERPVLDQVVACADIVQIGARNMKAYGLLQELAMLTRAKGTPVLIKRGESSSLEDFLLAAEYVVANGNPNVMLCLRGIRTFEDGKFQRYTADIGAIPVLKRETNLPVIFDPSHAAGYRRNVEAMSLAAVAAGADGLLIETHHDPTRALCDGEQSVTAGQLQALVVKARALRECLTVCADERQENAAAGATP
jgi:3-deoxy-7-phosphoheptulonate synthase